MTDSEAEHNLTVWAVRLTQNARRNISEGWEHFAVLVGEEIADEWQAGIEKAFTTLAGMPGRCPVVEESSLFSPPPVRQLIYRRTSRSPAYRILFRMHQTALDAPFVRIIAVRHGAQAPLTASEIHQIDDFD